MNQDIQPQEREGMCRICHLRVSMKPNGTLRRHISPFTKQTCRGADRRPADEVK